MCLERSQESSPHCVVFFRTDGEFQCPVRARRIFISDRRLPSGQRKQLICLLIPHSIISRHIYQIGIVEYPLVGTVFRPLHHRLSAIESTVLDIRGDYLLPGICQQLIKRLHHRKYSSEKGTTSSPLSRHRVVNWKGNCHKSRWKLQSATAGN